MNMRLTKTTLLLLFLLLPLSLWAQKSTDAYSIDLTVKDKDTKEAIIMATVQLQPSGAVAVTNMDGVASIRNIEAGTYLVNISYVGYEPISTQVKVSRNMKLNFQMTPTTLALREVSVVARQNASGKATSSIIGRQAIDHLQATSLADIMQLVPGGLMGNQDLTSSLGSRLQIRSASQSAFNSTSAFGSPIIIDGVPLSNNGNLTQGDFSNTATTGTDMRNISADDIEEVEVIRGIPSAEYGDLTSGMVVVHSKIGVTPWQLKGKVNPGMMNYSLGKGLRMDKYGILNFNVDYAQAWGDPRKKTNSFDRYNFSLGYGFDISKPSKTARRARTSTQHSV